jgi:hypothetical protein
MEMPCVDCEGLFVQDFLESSTLPFVGKSEREYSVTGVGVDEESLIEKGCHVLMVLYFDPKVGRVSWLRLPFPEGSLFVIKGIACL